jgi:hypothetical protein
MADLWAVLGALAAVVLPLLLAWWLVGRGLNTRGSRRQPDGKIRREEER